MTDIESPKNQMNAIGRGPKIGMFDREKKAPERAKEGEGFNSVLGLGKIDRTPDTYMSASVNQGQDQELRENILQSRAMSSRKFFGTGIVSGLSIGGGTALSIYVGSEVLIPGLVIAYSAIAAVSVLAGVALLSVFLYQAYYRYLA